MDWMPQAIRDGIVVILIISGPLVLAAAAIGLLVGILQAATQVQEQTIGSALKIVGVFALLIMGGFWMFKYLNNYTYRTLSTAFNLVPRQTRKVIPANSRLDDIYAPPGGKPKKLQVLEPEKLENDFLEAGVPAGAMLLGSPNLPGIPKTEKVRAAAPERPPQPAKPKPLGQGYQMLRGFPGAETEE